MVVPDRFLERPARDEPHDVERDAVVTLATAVDGHDAGMLQSAGKAGLAQEAAPARGRPGAGRLDHLERDLAPQVLVGRDVHLAQPPSGVEPLDAETRRGQHGLADAGGGGGPGPSCPRRRILCTDAQGTVHAFEVEEGTPQFDDSLRGQTAAVAEDELLRRKAVPISLLLFPQVQQVFDARRLVHDVSAPAR